MMSVVRKSGGRASAQLASTTGVGIREAGQKI